MILMGKILTYSLRRHTNKKKGKVAGQATEHGLRKSRELGRNLPSGSVLKGYSSMADRCIDTLSAINKGFKKAGGKVATGKQSIRKSLSGRTDKKRTRGVFLNFKKIDEYFESLGKNGTKFLQHWLDGKIPKAWMRSPDYVADLIIKDRIAHIVRFIDLKAKGKLGKLEDLPELHIENLSSDMMISSVFQRLTGEKLIKYANFVKPRESVDFYFDKTKSGVKVFLNFREKKFDVTKKLNEILIS